MDADKPAMTARAQNARQAAAGRPFTVGWDGDGTAGASWAGVMARSVSVSGTQIMASDLHPLERDKVNSRLKRVRVMLIWIVVVGFAVALSVFFLLEAALHGRPAFDEATVLRLGVAPSVVLFALCGPVMIVRAGLSRNAHGRRSRWPLTAMVAAAAWAGLVGVVAVETGRLIAIA
jgi:hypothetical protein